MICRLCHFEHPSTMLCNVAKRLRDRDATNSVATNSATNGEPDVKTSHSRPERGAAGQTANRRSRDAYNAYQRDYMRKVRSRTVN